MTAPPASGLRRFRTAREPQPERCGLCAAPVDEAHHRHLVDTEKRALVCACAACFLLKEQPGADGRFRAVPARYLTDPDHRLDDRAWESLRIPVGVAFFFRNTALDRLVALYPSPAGATESELEPDAWSAVLGGTALAEVLEPDLEALLLRRTDDGITCHLVPIDVCYELVGRMRLLWQGFDGGAEARAALDAFFAHVGDRARPVGAEDRA
ncbi:DUF5947 family protein [Streptomyces brasiliensis]|uniref:Uncharacterized protein n=1 Tax=Streptomyces brasiliensis TaxID=1954 RepID=A0A917NTK6_9ACTN|nr:DUF5947 family protein [Streptomyces brasiliensis]GGJ26750.1 hypothetical protein GCM10010121_042440 [Streptomyces brasiliensis]